MNKISFARRKVNELVSRKEKSICNKFREQNQDETSSANKESAHNKFHEQNQFQD